VVSGKVGAGIVREEETGAGQTRPPPTSSRPTKKRMNLQMLTIPMKSRERSAQADLVAIDQRRVSATKNREKASRFSILSSRNVVSSVTSVTTRGR
jgi:hypothetical protein